MAAAAQQIQTHPDEPQEEPRREPFTCVPTWLIRDPSFSSYEVHLYAAILSWTWGDPYTFVSVPTLADATGLCENTVRKYLRKLEKRGLLRTVEIPGQRTYLYPAYNPALEGKLERKRQERREAEGPQEGTPSSREGVPPHHVNPTKNHRTNKQSYSVGPAEPPNGYTETKTDDGGDNETKPEGREVNVSTRRANPNEVKELVSRIVSRLKTSGVALTERQRSRIGGELKTVRAKRGREALEPTVEALIEAWERGEALYPLVAAGISKVGSGSPATETESRTEGYEWWFGESSTDPEEARRREAKKRQEDYEWLFGE